MPAKFRLVSTGFGGGAEGRLGSIVESIVSKAADDNDIDNDDNDNDNDNVNNNICPTQVMFVPQYSIHYMQF